MIEITGFEFCIVVGDGGHCLLGWLIKISEFLREGWPDGARFDYGRDKDLTTFVGIARAAGLAHESCQIWAARGLLFMGFCGLCCRIGMVEDYRIAIIVIVAITG